MQHAVALLPVQHLLEGLAAGLGRDISHKGLAAADGADGVEVHTDAEAVDRHVLGCDLKPAACRERWGDETDIDGRKGGGIGGEHGGGDGAGGHS